MIMILSFILRQNPTRCTEEVIRLGKKAIDRYNYVLNFQNYPKASNLILKRLLNVSLDTNDGVSLDTNDRKSGRVRESASHAPSLSAHDLVYFNQANKCDLHLLAYANRKLKKMAACVVESK